MCRSFWSVESAPTGCDARHYAVHVQCVPTRTGATDSGDSRGISAALLATAIGIGTALFGLLGHNILHRISDVILEEFKSFLLLSTRF